MYRSSSEMIKSLYTCLSFSLSLSFSFIPLLNYLLLLPHSAVQQSRERPVSFSRNEKRGAHKKENSATHKRCGWVLWVHSLSFPIPFLGHEVLLVKKKTSVHCLPSKCRDISIHLQSRYEASRSIVD